MDMTRLFTGVGCRLLTALQLLVWLCPTRGGYLFMATPGYGGIKPAGMWGGSIQHCDKGQADDLFSNGYEDIHLPTTYMYDGIRINTLSFDPRTRHALVEVEDVQREITVVGSGALCARDPYVNKETQLKISGGKTPLTTIIPDVKLDDGDNPFFMHTSCGWKCGWGGFVMFGGRLYFVLSGLFGRYQSELKRRIEVRALNNNCDEQIQHAIKYDQVGTELPVLECSDHVVTVYEHRYSTSRGQQDITVWAAGPLKVVQDAPPRTGMFFLLQIIKKEDCDVTMSLLQMSNLTSAVVWVHNVSLPSIYGGNARIRGFGSIDYRDGMLCWTAAEVLLCGPIANYQVSLVSMLLPPGAAHTAGICTGDLPLGKVLTGVAVASSAPLRVYFGCYSELSAHGGAGLVVVNLSSANEIVKHIYAVTSSGKKVFASALFHVDSLCGSCNENCDDVGNTTSAERLTSGVVSSTSWLDGNTQDGALTGTAHTAMTMLKTIIFLFSHTALVFVLIL